MSYLFRMILLLLFLLLANPFNVHSRILRSTTNSNVHSPQQNFDSIEAVARARRYLKKFGYLQEQLDHATNNGNAYYFDKGFEGAIKKFQQHYNLEVSGKLDSQTTRFMLMPRCGVPDHLHQHHHGGFSNNLIKVTSKFAFFEGFPSWPGTKRNLTYSFDPSGISVMPQEIVREAFKLAFSKWSQVSPFKFKEVQGDSDIMIGFYRGEHGDGEPFNKFGPVLAHAFAPIDGRLHVNGYTVWSIKDPIQEAEDSSHNKNGDSFDLVWVAMHEIGHILGLDHSNDEDSIMYPFVEPLKNRRTFSVDDVTGIQVLYSLEGRGYAQYSSAMGTRLNSYHLLIVAIVCLWVMFSFLDVIISVLLDSD
ncbi:hypothetical protein PIB30_011803 [Stylosanthes scabra]|uniref:Peptidase metallopeptidase domain-containing protein n=1 Tax=Stylosanthes scabra TaxID=79078 RepID=A0ABU6R4T8_9FABA|nr:hypothetical protein [Stylosanthes scabra]